MYAILSSMKLAKNLLFVINMTLASWMLIHSYHLAHADVNHVFASFEVEEKAENHLEYKEDLDHYELESTLFLMHSHPNCSTTSYSPPDIYLFDVPPKSVLSLAV